MTSDLLRASQTAQISTLGAPLSPTPLLREIFLGQAEGFTRDEIQIKWKESWEQWNSLRWQSYETRFPGGESRREGLERFFMLFQSLIPLFNLNKNIGLFTHGLILRSFAQWATGSEIPQFTTPNCCVYEWDGNFAQPLHFNSAYKDRPRLRQIYLLPDESLSL